MSCKLTDNQISDLHAWAKELGQEVAQAVASLNREASMGAAREGVLRHFAQGFDIAAAECALKAKREEMA